jgi:uncharacterized protein (DUF433 family)
MKSDEKVTVVLVDAEIINRGRGPEIKGTRVTVYDVLDYVLDCWPQKRIADWFNVTVPQVEAAVEYIQEHTIEVLTDYIKILERAQRGNSPEVQARLAANHARFLELKREISEVEARAKNEIRELIRKHRAQPAKDPD